MSTAMFDAREVLIPGSAYDRNTAAPSNGLKFDPNSFVRHDQLGYIGHERNFPAGMNLPVPVGMFMPTPIHQPFIPPVQGNSTTLSLILVLFSFFFSNYSLFVVSIMCKF